jgi:hypothetical protein
VRLFQFLSALVFSSLLFASGAARADRVDDLCRALTTDPSWRVRVQAVAVLGKLHDGRAVPALVHALADDSEAVRELAAQTLGSLGDSTAVEALERARRSDTSRSVRERAELALARLHGAPTHAAANDRQNLHVEVGGIGNKAHRVSPELTQRLRDLIIRELQRTPGLTLEGKPLSGFLIDSSITTLERKLNNQWVEITCEVSYVVGRLPSKAMVMMTSGGATVQAPRMGLRPEKEKALQVDALEGAVQGAHENLLAFLKTQRSL